MKRIILSILILTASLVVSAQTKPTCKGLKKDGQRCRITFINKDGYCRFHDPNVKHCAGIKKDGTPCKMRVEADETYCEFHKPKTYK